MTNSRGYSPTGYRPEPAMAPHAPSPLSPANENRNAEDTRPNHFCDENPSGNPDAAIQPLVAALAAVPGIEITGACEGHVSPWPGDAWWWITWRLASADSNRPLSEAGAHPMGVLNTERLLAHVADYHPSVQRDVLVPPPWRSHPKNVPGTCLQFEISGYHDHGDWDLLTPDTYLRDLQQHWAEAAFPPVSWSATARLSDRGQK